MKIMICGIVNLTQRIIFTLTYYMFYKRVVKSDGWLVLGAETASLLRNIGRALPGSSTVNLAPNRFYSFGYDFELYAGRGIFSVWAMLRSPVVLAKLVRRHKGIVYVGGKGLFWCERNGRRWEFAFLRKQNKRIVCYFTGSDIRSLTLMNALEVKLNRDVITTYQGYWVPDLHTAEKEQERKILAEAADEFAEHIFNPPVDQCAYITRKTHPFLYFVPHELFYDDVLRFDDLFEVVIVHAPSAPIIKGTPLVRAAIRKLRDEGYSIKYEELSGVPHHEVISALRRAHIVLNEFYAFVPGVFGVEAMANSCALLTSADPLIEPTLPPGSETAWVVTPYWLIYDKLKELLDNPHAIRGQAMRGYEWTRKNYHIDQASAELRRIVA